MISIVRQGDTVGLLHLDRLSLFCIFDFDLTAFASFCCSKVFNHYLLF